MRSFRIIFPYYLLITLFLLAFVGMCVSIWHSICEAGALDWICVLVRSSSVTERVRFLFLHALLIYLRKDSSHVVVFAASLLLGSWIHIVYYVGMWAAAIFSGGHSRLFTYLLLVSLNRHGG